MQFILNHKLNEITSQDNRLRRLFSSQMLHIVSNEEIYMLSYYEAVHCIKALLHEKENSLREHVHGSRAALNAIQSSQLFTSVLSFKMSLTPSLSYTRGWESSKSMTLCRLTAFSDFMRDTIGVKEEDYCKTLFLCTVVSDKTFTLHW